MTSSYSKDIQHLKEMYKRKENNEEIFEVAYFDNLAGASPEIREIVN
jgi:uncharacterized pyridoxamine 5'-phosphate oxidase family protein